MDGVYHDFSKVREHFSLTALDDVSNIHHLVEYVWQHPEQWRPALRIALARWHRRRTDETELLALQQTMRSYAIKAQQPTPVHWPVPAQEKRKPNKAQCPYCNRWIRSRPALASHISRLHRRGPPHYYAAGTYCPSCVKQYTTRFKLRQHLSRKRSPCLKALRMRTNPLSYEEVERLFDAEKEQNQ